MLSVVVYFALFFLRALCLKSKLQIKPPSSPEGRFTQILSVGIGGSALGPQFVAEALAPDNPPLKVYETLSIGAGFAFSLILHIAIIKYNCDKFPCTSIFFHLISFIFFILHMLKY